MSHPRIQRLLISLLTLLVLLTGPGRDPSFAFLERAEQQLYDWRMRLQQQQDQDPRIVIVDIDERSLAAEGHWPWPRDRLATLVQQLFDHYDSALLAMDVVFAESERLSGLAQLQQQLQQLYPHLSPPFSELIASIDPDLHLAQRLADYPVVLGYPFSPDPTLQKGQLPTPLQIQTPEADQLPIPTAAGYTANLALLQQQATTAGFFDNPLIDSDGLFRRVPMLQRHAGNYYPSLSLAVMTTLFGSESVALHTSPEGVLEQLDLDGFKIPVDANGAALVPYRGPQGSFPYVSASAVLKGNADKTQLEGAIVLLGTSAAGLLDLRATPVQNAYPGVEVHANLIAGMLDEALLHRPDYMRGANLVQCLVLGLVMVLLPVFVGPLWTLLVSMLCAFGVVAGNLYLWSNAGHVLPLAPPLLVLLSLLLLQLLLGYLYETRRHQQLSGLFGQYVPPSLVDEMTNSSDLALGGDSREMTVLFADIRGFTSLSEQLTPQQLSQLMQLYLSPMTEAIHQHRGTIDKYIGDAVMAFWGAPLRDPDHGKQALAGALAMLERLPAVNAELQQQGLPAVQIGIGLNSGEMSVGNMGSRFRMAYTVLGDAVNLGSRLEGLTKLYSVALLVSESLRQHNPQQRFRQLDRVRVKGKNEPVAIYEPITMSGPEIDTALQLHQQMLDAYWSQQWLSATALCHQLLQGPLGQPLYRLYLERIAAFEQAPEPLGPEWDGVYQLTHK